VRANATIDRGGPLKRLILTGDYVVEKAGAAPIADGAVVIENERVTEIMPAARAQSLYSDATFLGGPGHVVIPGLIDAHQHGRGVTNIQRGVADGQLELWLTRLRGLWPMDVYLTTAIAAVRLLRSGVTTAMHHFSSAGFMPFEEELRASLQAYHDVGIRVTFTLDFRDRSSYVYAPDHEFLDGLPKDIAQIFLEKLPPRNLPKPAEILALLPKLRRDWPSSRIKFALGPQGLEWSSDASLCEISDFARAEALPFHTHVLETRLQREASFRNHGMSSIARLSKLGLLKAESSLAHMVWASDSDLAIVKDAGAIVVHNPASNLRLKSGIAPVLAMLRNGIPVAIGMDGMSISDQSDIFQDLRLCQNLHFNEDGAISTDDIWRMVYEGGSHATFWGERIGHFRRGAWGDAVVMQLSRDALVQPVDSRWHVLQRLLREGSPSSTNAVVVGGQVVVKDGVNTSIDEAGLMDKMQAYAANVNTEAVAERRGLVERLEGAVADFYRDWRSNDASPPFYSMNRH
jgi:cytosine/adenosine deaminase-related metal-dependent hydrolase